MISGKSRLPDIQERFNPISGKSRLPDVTES
jgi:hypothetical protein